MGGSDAYEGEFPWTVSLFQSFPTPAAPRAPCFSCWKRCHGDRSARLPEQRHTGAIFIRACDLFTFSVALLLLLNYYLSA